MKDKYCLPIISSNFDEIRQKIEVNEPNYGYFELWLDYVDNFETTHLMSTLEKYPGRIILVFRRQKLEPIKTSQERRKELLDELSGKDCLVDFDITCQEEDLEYVEQAGLDLKKIVSFHDYSKTPKDEQLFEIVTKIESFRPDILKVSAFCQSHDDALRLLRLEQKLAGENLKHIVLGMGEKGLVTRIFATLWGNALAFVPENDDEQSAKGQITREKFEKIMKELEDI